MANCDVDCYGKCNHEVYINTKCILHCKKNSYQADFRSGLLSGFFIKFIDYILDEICDEGLFSDYLYSRDDIEAYLRSMNFDNEDYNKAFEEEELVISCIHFPTRDARDKFDYLKVLRLFGSIHFNYSEFYLRSLDLQSTKCFFQDCTFHESWSLYNFDKLENEDDVIYQTCIFKEDISNFTPEENRELAVFDYSQFDYTCTFKKSIIFNRAKFREELFKTNQLNFLDENKIQKIQIEDSIFEKKFMLNNSDIDEFILRNSIFNDKFEFKDNRMNTFLVDNSNFSKMADFYGSKFIEFKIVKSIFDDFTGFEKCEFGSIKKLNNEVAVFLFATFNDFLNFRNTKFKSGLDIENINIKEPPNFLNT